MAEKAWGRGYIVPSRKEKGLVTIECVLGCTHQFADSAVLFLHKPIRLKVSRLMVELAMVHYHLSLLTGHALQCCALVFLTHNVMFTCTVKYVAMYCMGVYGL